jgi:thiamine pyrophosphate-dependent acetolactate synthase large subunit-like protein
LARWDKEGRKHPEVILCPHEVVAVHMAAGYALATGRGQAVFVHVDAGTANACMAIQNLFRYRLPVMLFAGRAPYTLHGELTGSRDTYVHFVQDPFDIASIVRSYVKWEYSLPSGIVVKEALARASAFMQSDPPGPVYMMLPRETLAEQWNDADMPAYPPARYGSVHAGGIEPARIDAIAQALMAAENPIALTAYLGRKPQAVAVLDRLARTCGIRVAEFNSIDLNIPQDSPCFAGFDPLPLLETADLGLLLDSDVPYIPQYTGRAGAIKWIQIDIDPLKSDFPMWGFPTDMRIQGDCDLVLQQLLDVVESRADDAYRRRVAERTASWNGAREQMAKPRCRKRQQGRLRRAKSGLRVRNPERKIVAGRYRHQRGDPQRTNSAGARHAYQAAELRWIGRRRTRIQRWHGAGIETGAAGSPHRAGDRRRRLSFFLARQRLCGGAAISDPRADGGAGQWRLAGGEIRGAAGLSKGHCRRNRPVSVAADVGPSGRAAGFLRGGTRVRSAWRMRQRAG